MNITRLLTFDKRMGVDAQHLYWSIGALIVGLSAHVIILPPWITLTFAGVVLWRILIETKGWRLPPKYLRVTFAVVAMGSVAVAFRTINGLDAGTALLTIMAGMKILESRSRRDYTVLIFISYVLLFAALLSDQSLLRLPYILGATWLLAATLLRLHQTQPIDKRKALRLTGTVLLQALPLAILLFLLFPRLPGQFWALPSRHSAATGLSDEMTPGDISSLTQSGEPAFRVKFEGALPPPSDRYWRGPVLHEFNGRRWRRGGGRMMMQQTIATEGVAYRYKLTQEPTQRDWVFALDVPTSWPEGSVRLHDLQLVSRQPLTTLSSFTLESHARYRTPLVLTSAMRNLDTALPGKANPRMREFATTLRAASTSDLDYARAVLDKFRREEFFYTLSPPLLGDDAVDEFLFETRRGFCEHFASAFTSLMRAANIPARVVTGYQGGEFNSLGDYLLVKQSDAHAWSEIWLKDQGWVRIDPTAAVAPDRVELNLDAAIGDDESVPGRFLRINPFFSRARLTWDAVNNFWNNRVVDYNELKQRSLMQALGIKNPDYRTLVIAIAITFVAFFLALTAYLGWKHRPAKRDPLVTVYSQLCRKLARVGLGREDHEGPVSYLQRVAIVRPDLADQLRELRALYANLRYGPDPLQSEASRFKYLVNQFRVSQ